MIRLIAAIDEKRGIAKNGVQPWKIPDDEQYFSDMTKEAGGNILMGKTTLEVMGKPLAGRTNFVLTHEETLPMAGIQVVHSDLGGFFRDFTKDIWVIGGASVYEQTLPYADELYLTQIAADFDCDQFFPEYRDQFALVEQSPPRTQNELTYRFEIWRSNASVAKPQKD